MSIEQLSKSPITRRSFLKLGTALGATTLLTSCDSSLSGKIALRSGWEDYSEGGKKREVIPSACWQCVARDSIVGYVEEGRLMKIEGNPKNLRTNGRICAKGQAGINQVYDPDRVLYPLKRVGPRGGGQWQRIGWDEALGDIAARLKKLRDEGHPEKFMFHYGRMKGSDAEILKHFMEKVYGSKTIGGHTSICEGGKWTAQELVWGKHYDVNDMARTRFILNFGCNFFEAHTSHVPIAQRAAAAVASGVPLVTFDVRLSNTAARSREWIPLKPGTDMAVLLAMAHVIIGERLYEKDFIEKWTNVTLSQLKEHVASYTPEWAEQVSTVPAATIQRIAKEYAKTRPSTLVTYRGAIAHYHGSDVERAAMMLEALVGNINIPGGRCQAVGPKWEYPFPKPKGIEPKKLKILDGVDTYAYPTHHVCQQTLKAIQEGSHGRPEVYMTYGYNAAYVNGECAENIEILKDTSLIPFYVAVDPFMSESSELADIILPDATYLERWCLEDMPSYDMVTEFYIRQPLVKPLGEVREFPTVLFQLAKRIGGDVAEALPFASHEELVRAACEKTPAIQAVGGFEYMKAHGTYYDKAEKPQYHKHEKVLKEEDLKGTVFDQKTGVYWEGKEGEDYTSAKDAYKKYKGQKIGDKVYKGFPPDKINKSGRFEISSEFLKEKGFNPLPTYVPIPEHQAMGGEDLHLTTYKVNVQTHSRSQNCKWLTELYHDNPAWIHPKTAASRGIQNGDKIRLTSPVASIVTTAKLTEGIHPSVVAISNHCGHWAYGRYASGKAVFPEVAGEKAYWKTHGTHPNWIIANKGDPISGQMRWMDTVVTVEKV